MPACAPHPESASRLLLLALASLACMVRPAASATRADTLPLPGRPAGDSLVRSTMVGKPGFYRLGQTQQGYWWFLDPDDKPFLYRGVTSVNRSGKPEGLVHGPYTDVIDAKFGPDSAVFRDTAWARLRAWGFNALGAWNTQEFWDRGMPFTLILNLHKLGPWAKLPDSTVPANTQLPDVFSADWDRAVDSVARALCDRFKDSKTLVGYFTANEMGYDAYAPIAQAYARKDPTDSVHTLANYARTFFRKSAEAIRRYDGNHLLLGCRFGAPPSDTVFAQVRKPWFDAVSANNYRYEFYDRMDIYHQATGLPIFNTEFSWGQQAFADRAVPGQAGLAPEQRMVRNGADAVRKAMGHRALIGWTWYRWVNTDTSSSLMTVGLLDIDDHPNPAHIPAVTALNAELEAWPKPEGISDAPMAIRPAARTRPDRNRAAYLRDLQGRASAPGATRILYDTHPGRP